MAETSQPSKNHSRTLLPAIQGLLTDHKLEPGHLEALVAGVGPGSFTGSRVGLALVKTMAFALEIPLVGVSTLRALAEGGRGEGLRVAPVLDALRSEVFSACFVQGKGELQLAEPEAARDPAAWASHLAKLDQPCLLLGSGALRYREVFVEALQDRAVIPPAEELHSVRASSLGLVALKRLERGDSDDPLSLVPNYCRLSEAEIKRDQAASLPLGRA